ncbi:DUF3152 domain-containing protein [Streptomyces gilvosporeus]|uniref:DUF3152 domain-containing protein n=1 Tax=Streptomyces gilvosporeus TaxID=553510 RepID=A0A1V0TWD2_9ACTN|nr:DUF3152 domain-containing protein [Streptomyces gilvosporeus]ARF57289.1 hypothetical protein B1H19_26735 [Streptomyces gilvosporeus]
MGRHSRRGRPEAADDFPGTSGPSGPPHGTAPAPGSGSGRRRRQEPPGDPAAEVRSGHPEQREPGGGWGDLPAPQPPDAPRIPRPRTAGAPGTPMGGRAAPGAVRGVVGGPYGAPGPRAEYVDAFDDDVFRAGAPAPAAGARTEGIPAGGRFTGRSVVFDRDEIDALDAEPGYDGDDADDPADPGAPDRARPGTKGRTVTGAAAAAVTTVLAVVIAGQVADRHKDDGSPQHPVGTDHGDGADGEASRSHDRPAQDAKAASYTTQMAQRFPLDARLTASGKFQPVGGDAKAPGHGKVLRYRVDVEQGLPLDGDLFAEAVHKTLNDDRSWAHGGVRTFQRVASGPADFVITLASPGTTAKWCAKSGLDTAEENVSCDSAATNRVMINAYRWAQGAKTYGPDKMLAYRQMLINHEVGHRLGHNHEACRKQGALAPVMMQQTKFLTTDGVTCRPNSWPYPAAR